MYQTRHFVFKVLYLKALTRNDFTSGGPVDNGTSAEAQQDKIAQIAGVYTDEFSLSGSYHELKAMADQGTIGLFDGRNSEISLLNRIGNLYHAWNQVALLTYFPAEVITIGAARQQAGGIGNRGDQGYTKLASDLGVAANLKRLESYLTQYLS